MEWIYFVVIVLIYGHEPKSLVGAIEYEIPDFAYIEKRRRNQYGSDGINDYNRWESFNLDDDNFLISNKTSASIRKKNDSPPELYGLIDDEQDHSNFQLLFYNRILNQTPNRSNFQTLMDRYDQANQPMNLSPFRIPYRKKIDIYNNCFQDDFDGYSIEENTVENIAEFVATNENIVGYNAIQTTEEVEPYWEENDNENIANELANNTVDDNKLSQEGPMINSKTSVVAIDSHPIQKSTKSKTHSSPTKFEDEKWNKVNEMIKKDDATGTLHSYEKNHSPTTNLSRNNSYDKVKDKLNRIDSSLVLEGQTSANIKTQHNITKERQDLNSNYLENQIESDQHWIGIQSHPICKQVGGNLNDGPQQDKGELDQINKESSGRVIVNHPLSGRFRVEFNSSKQLINHQKSSKNVLKSSDDQENTVWSNTGKLAATTSNNEPPVQSSNNLDQEENKMLQSSKKAMKSQVKGPGYSEELQKTTNKEIINTNLQKNKGTRESGIGYINSTSYRNISTSKGVHNNDPTHKLYNFIRGKINRLNNLVPRCRIGPRRENFISNLTKNNSTIKIKSNDIKDAENYNGSLNNKSKLFLENNITCTKRQDKIECLHSKEKVVPESVMKMAINKDTSKLTDKGTQIAINSTSNNNLQMLSEQDTSKIELLQTNRTGNIKTNSTNTEKCGRSDSQPSASNGTSHNLSNAFSKTVKSCSKLQANSPNSFIKENTNTMNSKQLSKTKKEVNQQMHSEPRKLHSCLNQRSEQRPWVEKKVQERKDFSDELHYQKFKETIKNINAEIQSDTKNSEGGKDKFTENGRVKRRIHWSFKMKNEQNETPRNEKVKEIELKVDSKRCKGCSLKETSIEMTLKKEPISSMSQQQNYFQDNMSEFEPFPIKINKFNPKSYMDTGNRSVSLGPTNLNQTDGISKDSFPKQIGSVLKENKINDLLNSTLQKNISWPTNLNQTDGISKNSFPKQIGSVLRENKIIDLLNSTLQKNKSNDVEKMSVLSPSVFYANETIQMTNESSSVPHINEDMNYLSTTLDNNKSNKDDKISNISSCAGNKDEFNERNHKTNSTFSLHSHELDEINKITNLSSKPQQIKLNNNNKTNTIFSSVLSSNEWNGDNEQCNMSLAEDEKNECTTDRNECTTDRNDNELFNMIPCIGDMQTREFPHLLNQWDGWCGWYGCPHLSQILAEDAQKDNVLNFDNAQLLHNATLSTPKRKGVMIKTNSNKINQSTENKWSWKHLGIAKEKSSTILPTLPIIEPVMHSNISLLTGTAEGVKEFRFLDNSSSLLLQNVGKLLSLYNDKTCKQSLRNELEPLRNSLREIFKNLGSQEGLSMLNYNTAHIEQCPMNNSPAINAFNLENEHSMIKTLLSNLRDFNTNTNSKRIRRNCYEAEKEMILNLNGQNREDNWKRSKDGMGSSEQAEAGTKSKESINLKRNIPLTQAHLNVRTTAFKNIKSAIINNQDIINLKIEDKVDDDKNIESYKREERSIQPLDLLKNNNGVPKESIKKKKKNASPEKIAVVHPIFFNDEIIMMNLTPRTTDINEPITKEALNLNKKENETLSYICRNKGDKLKQKIEAKKRISSLKRLHQLQTEKCLSNSQAKDAIIGKEIDEELNDLENQLSTNRLTSERHMEKDTQPSDNTNKLEETTHQHHHLQAFKSKIAKKVGDGLKSDLNSNLYSFKKKKKKLKSNNMEDHRELVPISEPVSIHNKEMGEEQNALNSDQFRMETFSTPGTNTEETIMLQGHLQLKSVPNFLANEQLKVGPSKSNQISDTSSNISRHSLNQDIDALLLFHDNPHDKITWHNSAVDTLLKNKLNLLDGNFERLKIPSTSTMAYISSSQQNECLTEDNQQPFSSSIDDQREAQFFKCESKQKDQTSTSKYHIPHKEAQPLVNRQPKKTTVQTEPPKNQHFQSKLNSKQYSSGTHLCLKKPPTPKKKVNLYVDNPQIDLHEEIQEGKHSLHQNSEIKLLKHTSLNKRRPSLWKGSRKDSISQTLLPKPSKDKINEMNNDNMYRGISEGNNKKHCGRFGKKKDPDEEYESTLEEEIGPQRNGKYLDDEDGEALDSDQETVDRYQPEVVTQNRMELTKRQQFTTALRDRISEGISEPFTNHNIQNLVNDSNTSNRGEFQRTKLQNSPWKNKRKFIDNARLKHKKKNNLQTSERDNTRGLWMSKKIDSKNNKNLQNIIKALVKGSKENSEMERYSGYHYDKEIVLEAPKLVKAHSKLNCKGNKNMGKKKNERAPRKSKAGKSKILMGLNVSKVSKEFDKTVEENKLMRFNSNDEEYGENMFETNKSNPNINYRNEPNDAGITFINTNNLPIPKIRLEMGLNEAMQMEANNDEQESSQQSRDEVEDDEINNPLGSNSETNELDYENSDELENNIQPSLGNKNQFISKEQNNTQISAEKEMLTPNYTNQEWGGINYPALNDIDKAEENGLSNEKKNLSDNEEKRIKMILEGIAQRYKSNSAEQSKINLKSGFNLKLKNLLTPGMKTFAEEDMKNKKKYPKHQNISPLNQNKILKNLMKKKNGIPEKRHQVYPC